MSTMYGYVRVSTREQNEDRQLLAMSEKCISKEHIYVDKKSGKDFNRPMYQRLLKRLKKNDILYITSIDRLGRNYAEILEQWRILTRVKKVDIVVIDMPLLDTTRGKDLTGTLIADLVLSLLSYVSENERCNIRSRQKEGIDAAKQKGVKFGRPPKPVTKEFLKVYNSWIAKEITTEEAARRCNFTKSTFYYWAKKQRATYMQAGCDG